MQKYAHSISFLEKTLVAVSGECKSPCGNGSSMLYTSTNEPRLCSPTSPCPSGLLRFFFSSDIMIVIHLQHSGAMSAWLLRRQSAVRQVCSDELEVEALCLFQCKIPANCRWRKAQAVRIWRDGISTKLRRNASSLSTPAKGEIRWIDYFSSCRDWLIRLLRVEHVPDSGRLSVGLPRLRESLWRRQASACRQQTEAMLARWALSLHSLLPLERRHSAKLLLSQKCVQDNFIHPNCMHIQKLQYFQFSNCARLTVWNEIVCLIERERETKICTLV